MTPKLKKKMSLKQEKRIAKDTDGTLVPLSGALKTSASWKGDVNTESEKFECKITTKEFYVLKFADLSKIRSQALKVGKEPVFLFEFSQGEFKNTYVCLFRDNGLEPFTTKSLKLYANILYSYSITYSINAPVYKFAYLDKGIERGISIHTYSDYIKFRNM